MPALRVLLTAFGSFPGAPVNPTMAIARRVERRHGRRLARLGVELQITVLPVVYKGAEKRTADLIAASQPHVVLHLGLAARRKKLSFETRARNRLSVLHPDAARQNASAMLIEQQGPFLRSSRAPIARCVAAISRAGAACTASIDAGDYLCNQTLYASLGGPAPLVAFLHAPRPRRLRAPRKGAARGITLDQMADGAFAAILEMTKVALRLAAN